MQKDFLTITPDSGGGQRLSERCRHSQFGCSPHLFRDRFR